MPTMTAKVPKKTRRQTESTLITSDEHMDLQQRKRAILEAKKLLAEERQRKKMAQQNKLKKSCVQTRRTLAAAAAKTNKVTRAQPKRLAKK